MNKLVALVVGIAAVAVAVLVGGQLIAPSGSGVVAAVPSVQPSPTPAPTTAPTPTPTSTQAAMPAHVPEGAMTAGGTYYAHPLPAPDDALTLTFTVPAGWAGFGDASIIPAGEPGTEAPGGMAFQFIDITSLNSDPCHWQGPDGDVSVGPTVDDLVRALQAQTAYEVSGPTDVSIGGYSGKRVDVVHPAELFEGTESSAPDCDEGVVRLWNTSGFGESGIYGQGPANRWQANILDVHGTRFVIVAQDFPGTSAADRAELDAIVDSMIIEP